MESPREFRFETDAQLIAAYPDLPYKLVMRWNDARQDLARAGEAFVAGGRVRGSAADIHLRECEQEEELIHQAVFGI